MKRCLKSVEYASPAIFVEYLFCRPLCDSYILPDVEEVPGEFVWK